MQGGHPHSDTGIFQRHGRVVNLIGINALLLERITNPGILDFIAGTYRENGGAGVADI